MHIEQINIKVNEELKIFAKRKKIDGMKVESTEQIIFHLDSQLGLMAKHLDEEIFTDELLLGLWEATLHVRLLLLLVFCISLWPITID